MLTAEAGAKQIAAAARLGARDYITKPFQEDLLLSKAARIIPLVLRSSVPPSIVHAPDTIGGQTPPPSTPELKAP
jgi:DNA-binding response OmpR family regulator